MVRLLFRTMSQCHIWTMFGLDFIYITEMGWETQEEVRALTAFLRSQEVHPS